MLFGRLQALRGEMGFFFRGGCSGLRFLWGLGYALLLAGEYLDKLLLLCGF